MICPIDLTSDSDIDLASCIVGSYEINTFSLLIL